MLLPCCGYNFRIVSVYVAVLLFVAVLTIKQTLRITYLLNKRICVHPIVFHMCVDEMLLYFRTSRWYINSNISVAFISCFLRVEEFIPKNYHGLSSVDYVIVPTNLCQQQRLHPLSDFKNSGSGKQLRLWVPKTRFSVHSIQQLTNTNVDCSSGTFSPASSLHLRACGNSWIHQRCTGCKFGLNCALNTRIECTLDR